MRKLARIAARPRLRRARRAPGRGPGQDPDRHRGGLRALRLGAAVGRADRLRHRHRQGALRADGRRVRDHQPVVRRPDPGAERAEDRRDHRLDVDHRRAAEGDRLRRPLLQRPGALHRAEGLGARAHRRGARRQVRRRAARHRRWRTTSRQNFPDARVQIYDTSDAANLDLASGRVDLVFADSVVLQRVPRRPRTAPASPRSASRSTTPRSSAPAPASASARATPRSRRSSTRRWPRSSPRASTRRSTTSTSRSSIAPK